MNRPEKLERDLTAWLADAGTPRVPDFTDDILWLTARTRQRPRWSFAERWLPVGLLTLGRRTFRPLPWRTLGLLAALALLIAAAAAFYVGSQPRLPPAPFGLAATGLVAYASGGDIYTVDPTTGMREAIVTGPGADREPRWSLDGTRVAFLRSSGPGESLVIVDPRSREILATTDPLIDLDTDSIAWSPDGRSIAIAGTVAGSSALYIVDTISGDLTPLPIDYAGLEVYWRPPDGGQLMFNGGKNGNVGLFMVDVEDGSVTAIAETACPGAQIRPNGWTPDGRRALITCLGDSGIRTVVLDPTTGAEVTFPDVAHGHVSNDGTRMVAVDADGRPCVANLSGGPCLQIGRPGQTYAGTHAAGAHWSPDDEWLLFRDQPDGGAIVVDPDGENPDQPSWVADGAESIQRVAP